MADARVTVRIGASDIEVVDSLVSTGEFRDRSELIRRAIKEFLNSRAREVLDVIKAKRDLVAEAPAIASLRDTAAAQKDAIDRMTRR